MSEINTTQMRIAMQDENYRNVWLNGTTHFDGCEYTHYPCAVLKLCDEVDALRAELAAARAEAEKCRPIPVSERMPKYFDEVLFYDNIADTWTMGYLNKGQWTAIDMLYWHGKDFKRITHWMPLPPAPEVER